MTTGSGIAIAGVWIGLSYLASQKEINGIGVWISFILAIVMTAGLK